MFAIPRELRRWRTWRNWSTRVNSSAVTIQSERGLQAAEAWVLSGASVFPDSFFDSPNGERWYVFGWSGTVAADGRFCGLKAALRSPLLHSYASAVTMQSEHGLPARSGRPHDEQAGLVERLQWSLTSEPTAWHPFNASDGSPLESAGSRRSFRLNSYGSVSCTRLGSPSH